MDYTNSERVDHARIKHAAAVAEINASGDRGLLAVIGFYTQLLDGGAEPDDVLTEALASLGAREPLAVQAAVRLLLERYMAARQRRY